jgi:hypothetical protein
LKFVFTKELKALKEMQNRLKEEKIRIKSLLAPFVILILYLMFFINVDNHELRIWIGIVTIFIMNCSYINFKHIIIYDIEFGIVGTSLFGRRKKKA